MNAYYHAVNSAKKFGGKPEDYVSIHNWFDQTKAAFPSMQHRAILHNAFGCQLASQVFGETITNNDGTKVPVRLIAEQHILEDLGFIPSIQDYLHDLPIKDWMVGGRKKLLSKNKKLIITKITNE